MLKGIQSLLGDSKGWVLPLVNAHALQQLRDLQLVVLPLAASSQPHNKRTQKLAMAIQSCLLGEETELPEDLWLGERAGAAATKDRPQAASSASSFSSAAGSRMQTATHVPFRSIPGPIAEADEGDEQEDKLAERPKRRVKERGMGVPGEEGVTADAAFIQPLAPIRAPARAMSGPDLHGAAPLFPIRKSDSGVGCGSQPGSPMLAKTSDSGPLLLGPFRGNPAAAARARKAALEAAATPAEISQEASLSSAASGTELATSAAASRESSCEADPQHPDRSTESAGEQEQQHPVISPEVYSAVFSNRSSETGPAAAAAVVASRLSRTGNESQDLLHLAQGSVSDLYAGSLSQFTPLPSDVWDEPTIGAAAAQYSEDPEAAEADSKQPRSPLKNWGKRARTWAKKNLHIGKASVQPTTAEIADEAASISGAVQESEPDAGEAESQEHQGAFMLQQAADEQISMEMEEVAVLAGDGDSAGGGVLEPAAADDYLEIEVGLPVLQRGPAMESGSAPAETSSCLDGSHAAASEPIKAKGLGTGFKQHLSFQIPSFKLSSFKHMREKHEAAKAASAAAAEVCGGEGNGRGNALALQQSASSISMQEQETTEQKAGEDGEEELWQEASELRLPSAMSSSPATPGPAGLCGREWSLPQAPEQGGPNLPPELALLQRLQEYMAPGMGHSAERVASVQQVVEGPGSSKQRAEAADDSHDVDGAQRGQLGADQKLGLQRLRSAFGRSGKLARRSPMEEGKHETVTRQKDHSTERPPA